MKITVRLEKKVYILRICNDSGWIETKLPTKAKAIQAAMYFVASGKFTGFTIETGAPE